MQQLTAIELEHFSWGPPMHWQDFNSYTEIDASAARWLKIDSRRRRRELHALDLSGMEFVSSEVALELSSTKHVLDLSGLTRLEDCEGHVALVRKLIRQENEYFMPSRWLAFPRLRSLAPGIAGILAKSQKHLAFGLEEIPVETARALSKAHGSVVFQRVENMGAEAAVALSATRGNLVFEAIKTPNDCIAAALANTVGVLELPGLTELNDLPGNVSLARKLASQGDVTLDSLTQLSPLAAEHLASSNGMILLNGLTVLDDATAAALSRTKARFLGLDGLNKLDDSEGHLALAETLATRKEFGGEVILRGLQQLTERVALAFTGNLGYLDLSGIEVMTPFMASLLSQHAGRWLILDGVRELSGNVAAEWLSCTKADGWILHLGGVGRFECCESVFRLAVEHKTNLGGFWVGEVPLSSILGEAGNAFCGRIFDLKPDVAAVLALSISKMDDSVAFWFSTLDVRLEFRQLVEFPDSVGGLRLAKKLALRGGPIIGNWREIKSSLLRGKKF